MEEIKLKITGALSYEMATKAGETHVKEHIINDVSKKVKKYINDEDLDDVEIIAEYLVIDWHYEVKQEIHAKMQYQRGVGLVVLSYNA